MVWLLRPTKHFIVVLAAFCFVSISSLAAYAVGPINTPISLDTGYTNTHSGADTWYSFNLVKGQGITIEINPHFSTGYVNCYVFDSGLNNYLTSTSSTWGSITNVGPSYSPTIKSLDINAQNRHLLP